MNRNLWKLFLHEGKIFFPLLFSHLKSSPICVSNAQLKAIFDAYGHHSKKDIEAAIKSETSGNLCRALLAIGKRKKKI